MLHKEFNHEPNLLKLLLKQRLFSSQPFCLVDVGAAGGIDPIWNIMGDQLKVYGFEPKLNECARLNAEHHPYDAKFFPCFLASENDADAVPSDYINHPANSFHRSSTRRYHEILTPAERKPLGPPETLSTEKVSMDAFFEARGVTDVDFIKTDTDGFDLNVLKGARKTLAGLGVLGLLVEAHCNIVGFHPNINLQCNVDRLLREHNFSLFDMEVHRYSRSALPLPFRGTNGVTTIAGSVYQGDYLYFRDPVMSALSRAAASLSPLKLLKLICLYDLHVLPDCAAEVLINFRAEVVPLVDVDQCLDLLVPAQAGQQMTYKEYMELFQRDPRAFLPR